MLKLVLIILLIIISVSIVFYMCKTEYPDDIIYIYGIFELSPITNGNINIKKGSYSDKELTCKCRTRANKTPTSTHETDMNCTAIDMFVEENTCYNNDQDKKHK